MALSNFLYYAAYTSAILLYGIGLNRAALATRPPRQLFLGCLKMLGTVSATATLTFLITRYLLISAGLVELYPFVAVLLFSFLSVFIEAMVRVTARRSVAEYSVPLLCVLLAVNESISIADCVLNACFCVLAYFLCLPVLYALRKRIGLSHPAPGFQNLGLLFISMAMLIIILAVWNVSWLTPGVLQ